MKRQYIQWDLLKLNKTILANMKHLSILLLSFLFSLTNTKAVCNDTLYLRTFIENIYYNHPLIKKAELYSSISEAYDLKGKGALDAKLSSSYESKFFNDTDYFTIWQSETKIPTILPIDFSVGYENNQGEFLNAENSVPNNGLIYGTVNLSLIRGLIFDDQRYNIRFAELQGIKSEIERDLLARDIIIQAISSYLDWSLAYNYSQISSDYFDLIRVRHENIIQLYLNGDRPAVDTIESRLNLNTAEKTFLENSEKLIHKRQKLSLFIWNSEGDPIRITELVTPQSMDFLLDELEEMSLLETFFSDSDPYVRKIANEIESTQLTNRLVREQLKPHLDLKYNTILNLGKEDLDFTLSSSDYKYGVTFQLPITNRKTRGEMDLNKAKIKQFDLDKTQYSESLILKYEALLQRRSILENIVTVMNEKITNSRLLYDAEVLKFDLGESSIFLLNQRERKLVEAQNEQLKNFYSLGKNLMEMYYLKLGQS
jgi:outer membrane protein TolC